MRDILTHFVRRLMPIYTNIKLRGNTNSAERLYCDSVTSVTSVRSVSRRVVRLKPKYTDTALEKITKCSTEREGRGLVIPA